MKQRLLIAIILACIGTVFSQPPSGSGVFENFVLIPAGWFDMGSADGGRDEWPVHRVWLDTFWMSETEVSIAAYLDCVESGVCGLPDWWNQDYFELEKDDLKPDAWMRLPVTGVSWLDACNFCKWKGDVYRLPTEAEWEYACRAGTQTVYSWGDDFGQAGEFANVGESIRPVREKLPNRFGLYDMIGNVWEWCSDGYAADYYAASPERNPIGPEINSDLRVVRGGSWNEYFWNLRASNRSFGRKDEGYKGVGFRIIYQPKDTVDVTP